MSQPCSPWESPLLPWLGTLEPLARAGDWIACLGALNRLARDRGLVNERAQPLVFIDAAQAYDMPYESHVWECAQVPTRIGEGAWHDFFNALIWLRFPRTKARLNALQAAAITREGVGARRGPLRDAATLFDENAAIVVGHEGAWLDAWDRRDWRELFVTRRADHGPGWQTVVFGHALLEKLRSPYKAICAHAWVVDPDSLPLRGQRSGGPLPEGNEGFEALDAAVAASLSCDSLQRGRLRPLPILGIPGWWPDNARTDFYDDAAVFRPLAARGPRGTAAAPRISPLKERHR